MRQYSRNTQKHNISRDVKLKYIWVWLTIGWLWLTNPIQMVYSFAGHQWDCIYHHSILLKPSMTLGECATRLDRWITSEWRWLGHALWIKPVDTHSKNNKCSLTMSHLQIVPIIHKPEKESKGYEWENEMTLAIGTTSTSPSNTGKTSHHTVIFDINPASRHTTGHYQLHHPCSVTGQALRGPEYRRRGTQHGQPWTVLNCKSLKAMVGHLQSLSNLLFAEHVPNFTGLDNQGC